MNVRFHDEADEEFVASIEFYEAQDVGLGLAFYEEVRKSIHLILGAPYMWPIKRHGCRRYLVDRFPFAIHYLVAGETVWIVALAHTSRRPYYWKDRSVK